MWHKLHILQQIIKDYVKGQHNIVIYTLYL